MSTTKQLTDLEESLMGWIIEQFQAVEDDTLDYKKRILFLKLLEESMDKGLIQDSWKKWRKQKIRLSDTDEYKEEVKKMVPGVYYHGLPPRLDKPDYAMCICPKTGDYILKEKEEEEVVEEEVEDEDVWACNFMCKEDDECRSCNPQVEEVKPPTMMTDEYAKEYNKKHQKEKTCEGCFCVEECRTVIDKKFKRCWTCNRLEKDRWDNCC